MASKETVSVQKAIRVGLLLVNLPGALLVGAAALPLVRGDRGPLDWTFLWMMAAAIVVAWLWWSLAVPRWRVWAYERVDDIPALKAQAVTALLVWPDGHFLSRTEIKSPALAAREKELEAASKSRGEPSPSP
jgi:hypothetical protein